MRTITITSLVQTDSRKSKLLEIGQTKVNPILTIQARRRKMKFTLIFRVWRRNQWYTSRTQEKQSLLSFSE